MLLSQIPPPNEICEYDDTAGLQAAQAEYEVRCLAWEVRWAATCFALVGSGVLTTLAELDLVTGPEPVEGSFKGPRAHEASHLALAAALGPCAAASSSLQCVKATISSGMATWDLAYLEHRSGGRFLVTALLAAPLHPLRSGGDIICAATAIQTSQPSFGRRWPARRTQKPSAVNPTGGRTALH